MPESKEHERERGRKDKALKEALALVALAKKARGLRVGGRGRLHGSEERRQVRTLVQEATLAGARLSAACEVLGISARTLQRWGRPGASEDLRPHVRRLPPNRLTECERQRVLRILHSGELRGLSPWQIVPWLADRGVYLASESTCYRLLRAERAAGRARTRASAQHPPQERIVTQPNQIWSWDISYLRGPRPDIFLYLYLVMDVFSRRIMGWRIHREEAAEHATRLMRTCCAENHVDPAGLILHSDNGGPMKGATLVNLLRRLGVVLSFSRPRVSNDNAFVETLFHTLKGRPSYPREGFASLRMARQWVSRFVRWYNRQHLHSGLGYITPDERYSGAASAIWERRARLYQRARSARPGRWSGPVRQWTPSALPRVRVRARPLSEGKLPAPPGAWGLPERTRRDNKIDTYRCDAAPVRRCSVPSQTSARTDTPHSKGTPGRSCQCSCRLQHGRPPVVSRSEVMPHGRSHRSPSSRRGHYQLGHRRPGQD